MRHIMVDDMRNAALPRALACLSKLCIPFLNIF